jgi:hypothetical protein
VRNELVAPDDPEAVAMLLGCSVSRAYDLTSPARDAVRAKRDAAIVAAKQAGQSNREIAREMDVAEGTVRAVSAQKFQPGKNTQDDPPPLLNETAKAGLDEMFSPAGQAWHAALAALREINALCPVDDLFADLYTRIDHAIGPELDQAFAWISDLHRRFHEQRDQRRRA